MRILLASIAILVTACERAEAPQETDAPARVTPAPWFICDGIDAPAVFVFTQNGATVSVAEYDKPNGAIVGRSEYQIGGEEGAAGSIYTTLMQNSAEAGAVRRINPGMLETPGAAFTQPFTSVRLGDRNISCRWLPRTRLMGFTGRRTIVVHEDADGDLIYTSYNFTEAATALEIELSENGRSTTFSAEIRDGQESISAQGEVYTFNNAGYRYVVSAGRDGVGRVEVFRGEDRVQGEPLVAFQLGAGD